MPEPLRIDPTTPTQGLSTLLGDWPGDIYRDIRYACRILRRRPAHASTVVATLFLGLVTNTVVFTITNVLLLRPWAVPDAHRVQLAFEQQTAGRPHGFPPV